MQLTEEQFRRLRDAAARRDVSIAELIREAVDRHLASDAPPVVRRMRAVAAIGGFRSGGHDVSESHDDHLADAFGQ